MQMGENDELQHLTGFVQRASPRTAVEKKIVSAIIIRYLDTGFWTIEQAIEYAPAVEGDVIDSTAMLAHRLKEKMSAPAARIYVKRVVSRLTQRQQLKGKRASRGETWENELLIRAVKCLLEQEPPNESDLRSLIPIAELSHEDEIGRPYLGEVDFYEGFARCANLRRELYLKILDRPHSGPTPWRYRQFRCRMEPDDIEWFIEQLPQLAERDRGAWDDLLLIAHARGTPRRLRRRAKQFVKERYPTGFEKFRKGRKAYQQEQRQQKENREERLRRNPPPSFSIAEAVEKLLKPGTITHQSQMLKLSKICFSDDQERPQNVYGKWEDLPQATRSQVLDVCEAALRDCDPTPTPVGSSFPTAILYEAWCFREVLVERPDTFPPDAQLIRKWLPSMFVVSIDGANDVLAACYRKDSAATEDVLIDTIVREARSSPQYMTRAGNLPEDYWSERLVSSVESLIQDPTINELPRSELLRVLASRSSSATLELARGICTEPRYGELWYAAADALLALDPGFVWPLIEAAFEKNGKDALTRLVLLRNVGIA
jgi:hypothetical protein